MHFSRSITFVAGFAALSSAFAGWNRLPYADARPVDLAAGAVSGNRLISSKGLGNADALIGGKIGEAITLAPGRSSGVIQLTGQQNIHTIVFNNDGAEGRITIGGSVDNRDWNGLGSAVFSAGDRVAQVHFATATVKYLSVNFESIKGGAIRAFEVFGTSTDRDYKLLSKDSGGTQVNLASIVGGARPIFAFPTPSGVGELSYLHNVFQFPKSTDKFRTIVYDLGAIRSVNHFATSHSLRPLRVEVFAFDKLPEKQDWRGKLTLDPAIFNSLKPVAIAEDVKGVGHVVLTPEKTVTARYVALRFEPNYQMNDAVAASSIATQNLIVATAGPLGTVLGGLGLLPEHRFTKTQGAGNGDLMVGSVEFRSDGGFEIFASNDAISVEKNVGAKSGSITVANNVSASVSPSYVVPNPSLASTPSSAVPNTSTGNSGNTNSNQNQGKSNSKVETPANAAPYVSSPPQDDTLVKSFPDDSKGGTDKPDKGDKPPKVHSHAPHSPD